MVTFMALPGLTYILHGRANVLGHTRFQSAPGSRDAMEIVLTSQVIRFDRSPRESHQTSILDLSLSHHEGSFLE